MKNIFWLSAHDMTSQQLTDLKRIYGNVRVTKVNAMLSTNAILDTSKDFDILAVVLPMDMIARLLNGMKNKKPIIRSVSSCTNKTVFRHDHWEEIKEAKFVTKRL